MLTMWPYPLKQFPLTSLMMPNGAQIIACQMQNGVPTLWVVCETENGLVGRAFRLRGTGHPIEDALGRYVATVQDPPDVWHVFEVPS